MRKLAVSLIWVVAIAVFLVSSSALLVEAADWQPVTTVSGSESQTTREFMISGSEWRVRWSYTPDAQFPSLTAFSFFVYPHGETIVYASHITKYGGSETSGTLNFHNGPGLHYIEVLAANTQGYTLKVEYDAQSVMSDSLIVVIVGLVIGIPVVLIVIISILVRKRVKRRKLLIALPPLPPPPP